MSQPGGSSGPSKKPSEAEKEKEEKREFWAAESLIFTRTSISALGKLANPFGSLRKFGKVALSFIVLVLAGSIIAPAEGGIVLAMYSLLVAPVFIMGLIASLMAPLLRTAGRAVLSVRNYIVRPIYDFLILMTIGLPWAITWFWEGKVIGVAAMFLGEMNVNYIGWAVAYVLFVFFIAGIVYSLAGRYTKMAAGPFSFIVNLLSGGSLIVSVYVGAIVAAIGFFIISLIYKLDFATLISNVGLVGGFLLSLASLDLLKDLAPGTGRAPLTWNVISMIIGVSALAGTLFYIYAMIAVTVYLLALYVVSQDGSWLWYALIAVPASPFVAYYFGLVTKVVIDGYGITLASILAGVAMTAFITITILVLLAIAFLVIYQGLITASVIGVIIAVIIVFILLLFAWFIVIAVADLVNFGGYISYAYQYLIQPA